MLQSANKRLTSSTQVALVCAFPGEERSTSNEYRFLLWDWCLDPPVTVAHELRCPALAEESDVCVGTGFCCHRLRHTISHNLESIGPHVFPIAAIHMTISLSVGE